MPSYCWTVFRTRQVVLPPALSAEKALGFEMPLGYQFKRREN